MENYRNESVIEIFRIFQIESFWNFPDWKFFECPKLQNSQISRILQLEKLTNVQNFINLENYRNSKNFDALCSQFLFPVVAILVNLVHILTFDNFQI